MAKWLVKTEPSECGIDDFARQPEGVIPWDGVRNYQARNFLAQMQEGDLVFIYHSSCKRIGIAGIVRVVKSAYPDPSQFNPESPSADFDGVLSSRLSGEVGGEAAEDARARGALGRNGRSAA